MTIFSVIVPTYNRLEHLKACLASVFAQRHVPLEIIVVDDGSSDGTAQYLSTLEERVRVITQQNAGPGGARNAGAKAARGEYLAFLDSDDEWFPWSLDVFATLLERYHHPSVLFASFANFSNTVELSAHSEAAAVGRDFQRLFDASGRPFYAGAGMMVIARNAFLDVGGFTEDALNAEDHDLALRLGLARGFVQTIGPTTVAHRLHDGNEMKDQAKNVRGLRRLIARENAGDYPGGAASAPQRRQIIARHVRPAVLGCIAAGDVASAAELYRATFTWNLRAMRLRFLAGALALMARARLASARVRDTKASALS